MALGRGRRRKAHELLPFVPESSIAMLLILIVFLQAALASPGPAQRKRAAAQRKNSIAMPATAASIPTAAPSIPTANPTTNHSVASIPTILPVVASTTNVIPAVASTLVKSSVYPIVSTTASSTSTSGSPAIDNAATANFNQPSGGSNNSTIANNNNPSTDTSSQRSTANTDLSWLYIVPVALCVGGIGFFIYRKRKDTLQNTTQPPFNDMFYGGGSQIYGGGSAKDDALKGSLITIIRVPSGIEPAMPKIEHIGFPNAIEQSDTQDLRLSGYYSHPPSEALPPCPARI